ncbi:hypothetical protein LINGRAHAP2_LOCUS22192 [Linum grandiflorum]
MSIADRSFQVVVFDKETISFSRVDGHPPSGYSL